MAEIGRQIGMLSDRIGERPIDPGISQLEVQVRQLVARMDQTGEQLSGLAKLYSEPAAPVSCPRSTSTRWPTWSRAAPPRRCRGRRRPSEARLTDTISGLEQRITAMLQGMRHDPEVSDFGGMQAGINEVNDRLSGGLRRR